MKSKSQKQKEKELIAKVYVMWKGKEMEIKEIARKLKVPESLVRQALLKIDPWLELNI